MNTLFNYRYCDASGYSSWDEIVFEGKYDGALLARLQAAFESTEFFIADQVRVPELFFETSSADDHCFHTFHRMEPTEDAASDRHGRSIEEFVAEVEAAAARGWRIFDPWSRTHPTMQERLNAP